MHMPRQWTVIQADISCCALLTRLSLGCRMIDGIDSLVANGSTAGCW